MTGAQGHTPPDLRVLQANERTLLAWIRTGLAMVTFGFGVTRVEDFLRSTGKVPDKRTFAFIGAGFVLAGVLAELLALLRYARIRRALLHGGHVPTRDRSVTTVAVVVIVLGIALAVLAWP